MQEILWAAVAQPQILTDFQNLLLSHSTLGLATFAIKREMIIKDPAHLMNALLQNVVNSSIQKLTILSHKVA